MLGTQGFWSRATNHVDYLCAVGQFQSGLPISSGVFVANIGGRNRELQAEENVVHITSSSDNPTFRRRGQQLLDAVIEAGAARNWHPYSTDPEELRYPAKIFVWVRWFLHVASFIELVYRPTVIVFTYAFYVSFLVLLATVNGVVHYRVVAGRSVTLRWMLALSVLDVVIITAGTAVGGGLNHNLFYLLYYPSLAWFAVFFSSFRLSFVWATAVAIAYAIVCLTVGTGLDFEAKEEKELFGRIVIMYAVVASVNLLARAERIRRQDAVKRERELQQERIELSQTIHDTTAQSVFMIGIGIDTARELAETASEEMVPKLEATSALSKSAMWELRHPIDAGLIFEGRSLSRVLELHAASFATITSIPAEVVLTGTEPSLPPVTRSRLFSIAHNAMTNALRHARASKVSVALDFQDEGLRMSVSDDGIGLPDDYAERGHGFRYMRANAERMKGRLHVEPGDLGRGTIVMCEIKYEPT